METHVKAVAVLNIVLGAMGLLAALIVLLFLAGQVRLPGFANDGGAGVVMVPLAGGLAVLVLIGISAPLLVGGFALLRRARWARVYMIVLSVIELFNVPFGTAVGIYSIWTLTRAETSVLFERRSC